MKKLIATLSVAGLIAATSFTSAVAADSAVFLNNFEQNDFAGVPVLAVGGGNATSFYAEVLGGVLGGPLFAIANVANSEVKFTGAAGIFNGNYGIIPTVAAGATGQFEVRVWQGTVSDTFNTATIRGTSGLFTQVTGTAPLSGGVPNGVVALNIPGASIQLAVVPEPSVIALGVLGGLGLLLRRRK